MNQRNLLWLIPCLAVLATPLWRPAVARFLTSRQQGTEAADASKAARKDFAMTGVTLRQRKAGEEELRLTAASLRSDEKQEILSLDEVRARVRSSKGPTDISGRTGEYDTKQEVLAMSGDVRVALPDGYELRAESLRYLAKPREMETDSAVELAGDRVRVSGTSLWYAFASGDFKVGKRVKCRLW